MSEKVETKNFLASHTNSPEFLAHLNMLAQKKDDFTFPITSISQVEEEALRPVYDAFCDLNNNIGGLNKKIGDIVKRQNEDFVSAYKYEMYMIQKDLKDIKKKYEEFMLRASKSNVIENLEKQLSFFRDEAWKLKEAMDRKDKEIYILKGKLSMLEDERKFLSTYIMKNVKEHKLIKLDESFGNPKKPSHKQSESVDRSQARKNKARLNRSDFFSNTRVPENEGADISSIFFETGLEKLDEFLNYVKQKDFTDKIGMLVDIEAFYKDIVNHYEFKLKDLHAKFSKEKVKVVADCSMKAIEKNETVDFFQQCVEKVRQNIIRRKAVMQAVSPHEKKKARPPAIDESVKVSNNEFMAADRQFILELFLTNEKVLGVVQNMLTTSLEKRGETRATSAIDASLHLKGLESETDPSILTSALGDTRKAFYQRNQAVLDSTSLKFPSMVDESVQLKPRTATSDFNPYDVNTKFGQLFGKDNVPPYKPRSAHLKNVRDSYKS